MLPSLVLRSATPVFEEPHAEEVITPGMTNTPGIGG